MKETIQKMREYLDYIEEHYDNVQKAWEIVKEKCKDIPIIANKDSRLWIEARIRNHDKSKLHSSEFQAYRAYFYPTQHEERYKDNHKADFDRAWESHWTHNEHHWQCWTRAEECEETYICIVEMICDWMAMGMKFGDTAQSYYENNKTKMDIAKKYEIFMNGIFNRISR